MIKVLIVDDHALFRRGLRNLLATYPDIEVVGESASGAEAIAMLPEVKPDLVLLDIGMPGMNGLEALKRMKQSSPDVKVLVLTQYDLEEYLYTVLRSGGHGYVLKETASEEIVFAIRATSEGRAYLSPGILQVLIDEFVRSDPSGQIPDKLTPREEEILKLLALGRSGREVADRLGISLKTVQTHRYHIMDKLAISNRAELVRYAIRKGIISADA